MVSVLYSILHLSFSIIPILSSLKPIFPQYNAFFLALSTREVAAYVCIKLSECVFFPRSIIFSDCFNNGQIDLRQDRKAMKRSNHDREAFMKAKEPRLEVEDTTTSSSSSSLAARDRPESHNNSSDSSSIETSSVRKALRRSLELKKERTLLQASSEESILKKITEGDERLREWSQVVSSGSRQICCPFPNLLWKKNPWDVTQGLPF